MAIIIPIYPVRRAVDQLRLMGRLDLRRLTAKVVVSELAHGRDGLSVMRQLQAQRLGTPSKGGAA